MQQFTVHIGTAVPLRRSDVDTDQIIPVRFLTLSERTGHADSLFADWRDDPDFVLNREVHKGSTILLAGNDFGTGSSREYAVWALLDYGFRAVVAPRFGDIFRGNASLNGLLPVVVPAEVVERLWQAVEADSSVPVTVDLERLEVRCGPLVEPFTVDERARERLLAGTDPIDATLAHRDDIEAYEANRRRSLPVTGSTT
ncbi:MAG TPA: 3-isopropylmalate dehydratase small subunit [Umezawaea sp.]|nr:3-isopropylmalate dehydratase small subunit [Umezawaea sp.]